MESDDDCDYMSDTFLNQSVKQDIRPGLIKSRSQQRNHDLEKKKAIFKTIQRPIRVIESEQRSEGLSKPITSNNKGFALLQKMGYKPGEALGKSGTGRTEPIPIDIKTGRKGLGRDAVLREIGERKLKILRRRRDQAPSTEDFRRRMTRKAQERQIESDLRKSQRVCLRLDTEQDKQAEPAERWFWPEKAKEEDGEEEEKEEEEVEEEEEEEELENADKLELLTEYLRTTYMYCLWCGTQYDDSRDFQQSCPGPTKDDH